MTDPVDQRFFQALKEVCATTDEVDPTCLDAISKALKTGESLDLRAARLAVDNLDAPLRDKILARVHRQMATDLSAIWGGMANATTKDLPN